MGVASVFVCTVLMENAVLQASGREKLTMLTMISGGVVKIVVNWFLVARRPINIYGAPVGTLVSYLAMAAMNYIFMCTTLESRPKIVKVFAAPLASGLLMGAAAWAVYGLCSRFIGVGSRLTMAVSMFAAIFAAVLVYLAAVIFFKAVTKEDMKLIPGGEKIARILHMA